MKKLIAFFSVFALSGLSTLTAFSAGFEAGENLLVNDILAEDSYVAGANAVLEETVEGDLYIAGGSITINGDVTQDLVVAGGKVVINGNVGDDLRVASGDILVTGNVAGDVLAFGGKIDFGRDVNIGGDLVLGTGYATLDGHVAGDVNGGSGMIILNGSVDGNVIVSIEERLEISDQARIGGNLNYSAFVEMPVPEGVVAGETKFNLFDKDQAIEDVTSAFVAYRVLNYLSLLVILLVLVVFAPRVLISGGDIIKKDVMKSFGVGVVTVISGFIGSILLIATVIGMPLGVIAMVSLFIAMYFARIFAAVWLAGYLINFSKQKKFQRLYLFVGTAAGLLVYYLVSLIPFVGWLVGLVLFLIGLGGLTLNEFQYIKFLKDKNQI